MAIRTGDASINNMAYIYSIRSMKEPSMKFDLNAVTDKHFSMYL